MKRFGAGGGASWKRRLAREGSRSEWRWDRWRYRNGELGRELRAIERRAAQCAADTRALLEGPIPQLTLPPGLFVGPTFEAFILTAERP